ncbi:UDP-glycosyltransferase 91C1-like [Chenopodium quinoa]|uniref:Glycosyltransferase N-terminal domain-containing protein n=1 Tax=Chenopodium quinoa TaxID=63459 RepID=A0A803LV57_CHEQI|nr:UDP-glycosyltransferase 91C1-like [Chenopodium quinoa]
MEKCSSLKIVMIPWLAMGHLIPFLELSKFLAKKGVTVFFITTPKNIKRLPKIPANLSSSINLISLPLPHLDRVPDDAESSMDVPSTLQPLLKSRFDLLEYPITAFLEEVRPDWILYDFTSYWIPPIAAKIGSSCAYLALFNAATLSFMGPPAELLANTRLVPEDFTVVPDWIPFESDIAYRLHEVMKFMHSVDADIATPDTVRFGASIAGCDVVCIRTLPGFEPTWLELLSKLYEKTVLPIGCFFPDYLVDNEQSDNEEWILLKKWLDYRKPDSVLYVALGSESTLSQEELEELAFGLELSGIPFILVLRDPPGLAKNVLEMLPEGFKDRVADRGLVHLGWAPQLKILSHPSIRGFFTHCGWNSVVEGLGLGRVMVLFPVMNDQGLIARLLVGKGLGVEIARDEQDGSLRRETVAKAVRLAMVEKEGEALRTQCRRMKDVFGDKNLNGQYIEEFIHYLEENKK